MVNSVYNHYKTDFSKVKSRANSIQLDSILSKHNVFRRSKIRKFLRLFTNFYGVFVLKSGLKFENYDCFSFCRNTRKSEKRKKLQYIFFNDYNFFKTEESGKSPVLIINVSGSLLENPASLLSQRPACGK